MDATNGDSLLPIMSLDMQFDFHRECKRELNRRNNIIMNRLKSVERN